MKKSNPEPNESTEYALTKGIYQLNNHCMGCNTPFTDGETVLGNTVQSATELLPELANVICRDREPIPRRQFTHGIREVVVRDHTGTVANTRAQATQQVHDDPEHELVSSAHTSDLYPPDPHLWPERSVAERFGADGDAASWHTPPCRDHTDGRTKPDADREIGAVAIPHTTMDQTDPQGDGDIPTHTETHPAREVSPHE